MTNPFLYRIMCSQPPAVLAQNNFFSFFFSFALALCFIDAILSIATRKKPRTKTERKPTMIDFEPYLINPETKTIERISTFYNGKTDCCIDEQFKRAIQARWGEVVHGIGIRGHFLYKEWNAMGKKSFSINGKTVCGCAVVLEVFRDKNGARCVKNPSASIERLKQLVSFID